MTPRNMWPRLTAGANPGIFLALLSALTAPTAFAETPLTHEFTYQGRLTKNGIRQSGLFDFRFTLWADPDGPTAIGGPDEVLGVQVDHGLFIVRLNSAGEFGPTAFHGQERWLGLEVKLPKESGYTALTPRQKITAAPYAVYALNGGGNYWAANGNDIHNTNSGNVGIGTTTPAAKLDVAGAASIGKPASPGQMSLLNNAGATVVSVRTNGGAAVNSGFVQVLDGQSGESGVILSGDSGNTGGSVTVQNGLPGLDPNSTTATLIGNGTAFEGGPGGVVLLRNGESTSKDTLYLRGNDNADGGAKLSLFNGRAPNQETITLDGRGAGDGGELALRNNAGHRAAQIRAAQVDGSGRLDINRADGGYGVIVNGNDGVGNPEIQIGGGGDITTIHLKGKTDSGNGGEVIVGSQTPPNGRVRARLAADPDGTLSLMKDSTNDITLIGEANSSSGGAKLSLYNGQSSTPGPTIALYGSGSGLGGNGGVVEVKQNDGDLGILLESDGSGFDQPVLSIFNGLSYTRTVAISGRKTSSPTSGGFISVSNGQSSNQETIKLEGNSGQGDGRIAMHDASNNETLTITTRGTYGRASFEMKDTAGIPRVDLGVGTGTNIPNSYLRLNSPNLGAGGDRRRINLEAGNPNNDDGTIECFNSEGRATALFRGGLAGGGGSIRLSNGQAPDFPATIVLDAYHPENEEAVLIMNRATGTNSVQLGVDGISHAGYLQLRDSGNIFRIHLNGADGSACFSGLLKAGSANLSSGCDVAESFDLTDPEKISPGMVLVMDELHQGHLRLSTSPYDKKVAGIVSGAGGLQPGVKLGQSADGSDDLPIALSGRVYCYVDASAYAIEIGDLLTTSDVPGHAMKVTDFPRSQGAVLGKAMQPLAKGKKGLILVLVALQ